MMNLVDVAVNAGMMEKPTKRQRMDPSSMKKFVVNVKVSTWMIVMRGQRCDSHFAQQYS